MVRPSGSSLWSLNTIQKLFSASFETHFFGLFQTLVKRGFTLITCTCFHTKNYVVHFSCTYMGCLALIICLCFLDPPEIVSAPSAQQVVEGNGVILFCNGTGNPEPNVTWTKHRNNSVLSTSETLNLTKITSEDNGVGYKCKVENVVGSTEANARITVLCKCSSSMLQLLNKVVPASMYDHGRSIIQVHSLITWATFYSNA